MDILGIDYGTEHIGIALGSTESGLTEPLTTLSSTSYNLLSTIHSFVLEHHIDALVVGISEKISAERAKQFSKNLAASLKLPVHLADETFSSQEAQSKLFHKSRAKRASSQHAAAAAVILERWIEEQR